MAVVSGSILQLYVTRHRVYVELDVAEEDRPLKGFFIIESPDRDPRYSTLLLAASRDLPVELRTDGPIQPDEYAVITVVAVPFGAGG